MAANQGTGPGAQVVIGSSLLLFVVAYHIGFDQPSGFGPRIGIAIVGVSALVADRVYVWTQRLK